MFISKSSDRCHMVPHPTVVTRVLCAHTMFRANVFLCVNVALTKFVTAVQHKLLSFRPIS